MKKLNHLRWKQHYVSHLGCIKGCLNYLRMEVSDAWLYGATGHAFILNIADDGVCPSGPTAWHTERMFTLGRNIGYDINSVVALKSGDDFAGKKKEAWDFVRKSIDGGIPCYGWELQIPEFYVIAGYDDTGYLYNGPMQDPRTGHRPWQEVGESDIGVIEMHSVRSGQAADDATTVKEAFEFALQHAQGPKKWVFPNYKAGLAGFDKWIETVHAGEATDIGMAYNAGVWWECRSLAIWFLGEARQRLNGKLRPLLDEAIDAYSPVAARLASVMDLFPFPPSGEIEDRERQLKAVEHLKRAREAEEKGLKSLEKIVTTLSKD